MHAAFFVVLLCCLPSYLCGMITFMSSWPGRLFSSDIPDLRFSIAFERALVTVEVLKNGSVETAFRELLYPDNDNQICLSDIDLLVLPYSDRYVVFDVRVTVQEQNVYSSDHVSAIDTQTVSASVVTCKAIVKNMTAADFCNNRFLTLLDGPKQTAGGWKEILSYIGNDTPVCEATYDDGSVVTHQVTRLSGGDFTMIDVSPDNFLSSGRQLLQYIIRAGNRRQEFVVVSDFPTDIGPVLLFANSFGVEEIAYCTGEHHQVSTFDRRQSRIGRTKRSYAIEEKESFKADTGILSFPMANWWREVLRSKSVRLLPVINGGVALNDMVPVVISSEKAEISNAADHLPRFTFEYEYADRNHNVWDIRREGRIFDNTFDYTFN